MKNHLNIHALAIGEKAKIKGYSSEDVPVKLYELGLIPGSIFTFKRRLPLGGPVCIQIEHSQNLIALRHSEAASILIEQAV